MLAERVPPVVAPLGEWRPYPTADDRGAWEALPPATAQALRDAGSAALDTPWPRLPATLALDYVRTGDRGSFEAPHFARRRVLWDLVLAECVEGQGRFLDAVADALWSLCEETWWGWPAHLPQLQQAGAGLPDVEEPSIDLGVGESAAVVAWSAYLLGARLDAASPLLRRRVAAEVRRRVVDPFLRRDEAWHTWINNWNPWCHSNVLAATLAVEPDDERRRAVVAKAARGLDVFLAGYPSDGGCDEGPTYWTRAAGCLFDCLELLGLDAFDEPLIRRMAAYIVGVHIDGDWWVNFADGAPRFRLPGPMAFRFGRAVGDDRLAALGAEAARRTLDEDPRLSDTPNRTLPALFGMQDWLDWPDAAPPLVRDAWLPDVQVMTARSTGGSADGLFLAAKGGHNDEVHNHNDVGSFVVYLDGQPVLVDPGVAPYTALTFSARRYELWTMQSGWHNVAVVNGVEQRNGRRFAAGQVDYGCDDDTAWLRADLAAAYPAESRLTSFVRTVALRRGQCVEVTDSFAFDGASNEVALHLLSPLPAVVKEPGVVLLGDAAVVRFDPSSLEPDVGGRDLHEAGLTQVWGGFLTRVRLVARGLGGQASFTVLVEQA